MELELSNKKLSTNNHQASVSKHVMSEHDDTFGDRLYLRAGED